jgi:hypothetical protein
VKAKLAAVLGARMQTKRGVEAETVTVATGPVAEAVGTLFQVGQGLEQVTVRLLAVLAAGSLDMQMQQH